MYEPARRRILESVPDDALVLDVGGWAVPFPRADHVLDLAPYDTRGEWGYEGDPANERFTAETWVLTPEQRILQLWWEGDFTARERMLHAPGELDADLRGFVEAHGPPGDAPLRGAGRLRLRRRRRG